jgi:hypothetical protein
VSIAPPARPRRYIAQTITTLKRPRVASVSIAPRSGRLSRRLVPLTALSSSLASCAATALSAQRWFSVVWLSVLTRRQGAARFGLCRSGSPVEKAGTVPEARTRLLNAADFDGIGRADFSPVSV